MDFQHLPLPKGVSKTKIAYDRGRIHAAAGIDSDFPSEIHSDAEKRQFLRGYNDEMTNPTLEKEMSKYPTQLGKKAIEDYNSNPEEMKILRDMGWKDI